MVRVLASLEASQIMIELLVILSSIADTFTDGTSPVRPFLFLLFGIGVAAATLVPSVRREREVSMVAAGIVTLLFVTTFILQLYVFTQAGIPQHALATAITEEEITNTRLTHTHVGKAALTAIIPSSITSQVDAGSAILLLVPESMSIWLSMLLILGIILVVYVLSRRLKQVRYRRFAYLLLVSIIGYTAVTKSIDGGILSDGAIIAYVALMALLLAPIRLFTTYLSVGAIVFTAAVAIAHLSGFYWGEGYAMAAVLKGGVLLLVILALHHLVDTGVTKKSVFLSLAAVALVASISMQAISDRFSYLNIHIGEGTAMVRHKDGSVTSADAYVGMTTRAVIEQENLAYWYQPVMHRADGCHEETVSYIGSFTLAPGYVPSVENVRREYAEIHFVPTGDRYRAEITTHACLPERIKEIQALLREVGLSEAVIYGLEGGEGRVRDGDNNR